MCLLVLTTTSHLPPGMLVGVTPQVPPPPTAVAMDVTLSDDGRQSGPSMSTGRDFLPFQFLQVLDELNKAYLLAQQEERHRVGLVVSQGAAFMSSMWGLCLPPIKQGLIHEVRRQ